MNGSAFVRNAACRTVAPASMHVACASRDAAFARIVTACAAQRRTNIG
jgi:hypothetical protein